MNAAGPLRLLSPVSSGSGLPSLDAAPTIGLAWLARLRWGAVLSQLAVLGLGTAMLGPPDELSPILALIAVTPVTNLALSFWQRRRPRGSSAQVSAVLVLDTLVLTALLHLSGGAANPFTVFYLVHVALAAVLLDARGVWLLAAVTSAGFASLFLPAAQDPHAGHGALAGQGGSFSLHLQGMWLAYTLAAGFVGYFVSKTARALAEREARVLALTQAAARAEKLTSLATLAAGAAHELGSPLATIAVIAKEIERAATRDAIDPSALVEDARLLRAETARCHHVLGRLAAGAGELRGEGAARTEVSAVLRSLVGELGSARAGLVAIEPADETLRVTAPPIALVQVLASLVRNGIDATEEAGRSASVGLSVEATDDMVVFRVSDQGRGLDPAVLPRLGEPFFTTKEPGKGLGLGLFLACAFAEQTNGRLELGSNEAQRGAVFSLAVPRSLA